MARDVTLRRKLTFTALAWAVAFILFFPILWTILT
ncbi:MAG TPA: carbohydrate ABC transporter permease, partial [Devosia sp.]